MKTFRFLFFIVMFYLTAPTGNAQVASSEPIRYTQYSYMKVKPGMWEDYLKCEKAWKKIHLAKKSAGRLEDWSIAEVLSPSGASCEYDYVTRNTFTVDQYAASFSGSYFPENWQSLLTIDEIDLVLRTEEFRTLVKNETWTITHSIWADDATSTAKVFVFNYFTVPNGNTAAHTKVEVDLWKPVHDYRVKAGTMKGWLLLDMVMPFGASQPYSQASIDAYADMKQFLQPWTNDSIKKVHPDKTAAAIFKQTSDVCTIVKGEVRMLVDRLDWK